MYRVRLLNGEEAWKRPGIRVGRYHIDADKTGLFADDPPPRGRPPKDPGPPEPPEPPLQVWTGLPILLRCRAPRGRPAREGVASSEIQFQIQRLHPNGLLTPPEWYSAAEIRKGDHLDRQFAAVTGRREIDLEARLIFAQQLGFAIETEYPVRHSGFSGPEDAPAYVLHDGRALLPGGRISPGTIAGEPPLLMLKRSRRWREQFKTIPARPPGARQAAEAIEALLAFDPRGRGLCAAFLGARALFYSLCSMDVTVLVTGMRGTAKTSTAQILHWAEGPCAAADEPDMTFRATMLGAELMSDRARDCAFLIDDGERVRANDPGAPLRPDIVSMISNRTREAFDGAPAKIRAGRTLALAEQRRTQQLIAFSAETALGLEASVLARTIWWSFERGEIRQAPMLSADWQETETWRACQEAFTGAGHGAIRRVLDIWAAHGREEAVNWLRQVDLEASRLAAAYELGGESEDRPRIARGLAMIIAGAMLCDVGAETENLFRDLAALHGARLAKAQLGRLASGTLATVGFDRDWFDDAFDDLFNSGELLWLDAKTGGFLKGEAEDADWLIGLGYQWRPADGFLPLAKVKGGWVAADAYLADPGALCTWLERRVTRTGGTFPFTRRTLPAHLVELGFIERGEDGRCTIKPRIPHSHRKYPMYSDTPRILRLSFDSLSAKCSKIKMFAENPAFEEGTGGQPAQSHESASKITVPMSPMGSQRGDGKPEASATVIPEINPPVTPSVPLPPFENPQISPQLPHYFSTSLAGAPGTNLTGALDDCGLWIETAPGKATLVSEAGKNWKQPETMGEIGRLALTHRLGQLWLHPSFTAPGLPGELGARQAREGVESPFADAGGLPAAWRLGTPGKVKAWNRLTDGAREIHMIASGVDPGWPFGRAASGPALLEAVAAFRHALNGYRPRLSPAVTFEAMMRSLHKKGTDLSASVGSVTHWPKPMMAPNIVDECWLRPAEAGAWIHAADKSAAYLAAMTSLRVGFGEPVYQSGAPFDGRRAGHWKARVTMPAGWDLPPLGQAGSDWYVTQTLILALEVGAKVEIEEAWLFPFDHQPFQPLYKRLRAARESLMAKDGEAAELALDGVKRLYQRGIGNLASRAKRDKGRPVDLLRPDWRHAIQATSQANIIRNLRAAGLRPFGLRTDCIYFVAETPDLAAAAPGLKLGTEPGSWRSKGAMPAAELPALYRSPAPPRKAQAMLDDLTELLKRGR
jgi:hypothetical protein